DMHAIRESVNTLKAGGGISIFPEGTRNKSADGGLQEVKGGVTLLALKGNAPIVPLILHHKERIFRKNYLYVGEPFELTEFKGRLLDTETIAEASDKVAAHMQKARDDMEVFIKEKRWILQRKEKKARKKHLKKANAQAKKAYRAYLRAHKKAKGVNHGNATVQ
ncbi:MAG: 1-acyl-sn-glycerol-3-phosphate acyltransferase, partial [Clostridiales bacterium]|nr:1-acyl-sn-glycerol-3-phosphate acyltransferase [Clostridiales bacterium]